MICTMNSNFRFFSRLSNFAIFILLIIIILLKIMFYFLVKNQILNIQLGGGSDANYYDLYANGSINVAVNIWPVILRYLNSLNLYSRDVISYLLLLLNLVFIPTMTCSLAKLSFKNNQKYYLYLFLLCSIYPTIYFFTLDIYRDVFMIFIFLTSCVIAKISLESSGLIKFAIFFIISFLFGLFLLALRPYLGYAFILSLFFWKIKFTKKRVVYLGLLYFISLFIANYIGALDSLTEYRSGFEKLESGSTLGLDFSNPIMFIPNFILSFLGQMIGLYVTNPLALVLLLLETLPFVFMLAYVFKNIRLADNFIRFLIIFFVLYASVWLIGNDNLGTAVRLRIYNYLAIYISFFYILRLKNQSAEAHRL